MKRLSRTWRVYAAILAVAFVCFLAFAAYVYWWMFTPYEAPTRHHWAASKDAFNGVVASAPPTPGEAHDWMSFEIPQHLGKYDVTLAYRVKGGVVIYDAKGGMEDTGFAYLPNGPYDGLENGSFESPRFKPLGDGWYSFIASW